MKLYDYLIREGLSDVQFAQLSKGLFTYHAVRKYKSGQRTPVKKNMMAIIKITRGQVSAEDFYK